MSVAPRVDRPGFDRWDLACLLGLVALWFVLAVLRTEHLPLQAWDESRNAVNAYGMARGEGWLVPRFEGAPDHWNTKPPLLIWAIGALMRLGLPLLWAMRLPSMLAALLTLLLVWAAGRYGLRDRVAGLVGGLLLCSSSLYFGLHVARTGDYDALLILFLTAGVLAFWMAVRDPGPVRIGWFAVFGGTVVLAVLTKSVVGLFAPAALVIFATVSGRLRLMLSDGRVWAVVAAVLGACVLYYATRELYDPGFVRAVSDNELGGRFAKVDPGYEKPYTYFLPILAAKAGLGLYALPAVWVSLSGTDPRRRALILATVIPAALILLIVSAALTKLGWYAAPIVPLVCVASATGLSDLYRRLRERRVLAHGSLAGRAVAAAALLVLLAAVFPAISQNQRTDIYAGEAINNGQLHYATLFAALRAQGAGAVRVIDTGLQHQGAPVDYNPILRLDAAMAGERGLAVDIVGGGDPAPGTVTASCDLPVIARLLAWPGFRVAWRDRWCVAGLPAELAAAAPAVR